MDAVDDETRVGRGDHFALKQHGSRLPLTPAARPEAAGEVSVPGHAAPRRRLDDRPWAPLKIASGCDRRCAFCAIPAFRGSFVSRRPTDVVAEARWLAGEGVKELFLVSENSTSYGKDLGDLGLLEKLLPELAAIDGIERVRVSYLQPAEIRPDMHLSTLQDAYVMVVDDQPEAREMLAEILRDNGARVAEHKDGEQALAAFEALPVEQWPQVLICDLTLGDIDGYEVVGRIRAMEAERGAALAHRLPAIALSGHVSQEARLRSLLAGFQVHLSKPVDPNELLATVGSLLPARRPGTSYTRG